MRLTGWPAARAFLDTRYRVHHADAPARARLHVPVGDDVIEVACSEVEIDGHAWVSLVIALSPASQASLVAAAYINFEFTVGSLAIDGDVLCLRHHLPLEDLLAESLHDAVHTLVEQAGFVRAYVREPAHDTNPFSELFT